MGTRAALFKAIITFVGLFESPISTDRLCNKIHADENESFEWESHSCGPRSSITQSPQPDQERRDYIRSWSTEARPAFSLAFTPGAHIFSYIHLHPHTKPLALIRRMSKSMRIQILARGVAKSTSVLRAPHQGSDTTPVPG